ncbi:MAG: TIGR00289 family protein [Halobacteriota archaeon]|nr:TIGR00289 family protein [Halobacteriota archaeon]
MGRIGKEGQKGLMKLGALFSGGKDSTYALFRAIESEEVLCLISIVSKNTESYMFHTPNIDLTGLQARAIDLPLIQTTTEGRKEEELKDLKDAIGKAKESFSIEGIVTGAIESVYQSKRIQKICDDLGLWCFNPLWLKDQEALLKELIEDDFKVIISGIFAYPLDEGWLGREIDEEVISELIELRERYKLSPSGEGGEIETTVLDAPFFKKRIEVLDFELEAKRNSGVMIIKKARAVDK